MTKIFMFVNVDWFFLSHRLPIAEVAKDKGVEMTVFADFTSPHENNEFKGFSFLQSPIKRKYSSLYSSFKEFLKTIQLIKRERPSVIHAVTIKPIILLGIICFILKIPFIASISGLGPGFSPTNFLSKTRLFIIKSIYKIIFSSEQSRVICQSSHDAGILLNNGLVTNEKIIIVEGSGVDLEEYKFQKREMHAPIKVLMASRLLKDKGVREFCEAARKIQEKYNFKINFSLAGPIDYESPGYLTKEQIAEMCLSNKVEFIGNRSDLKDILAESHIFILPSYYAEGIPKVLLEAAASGCAVITTEHPGCRDAIIPGKTGMLIPPRDISSLINALVNMVSDRDLIESMGKAGRLMAEQKFCVSKVIENHYALYQTFNKDK